MPTLEIYYNPYKMETAVKINGDDVFNLSSHLVIQEFISNRIPLQTWINKIEYRSWNGLLAHLVSEDDSDELIIRFHGRALDFEDLKRSLEAQNNSRPPKCRVTLTFPKPQDLRLSDEKMMQNIDYVIEKLRSEEFKKIIEENGKKAATYQAYQELDRNVAEVRKSEFRIVFSGTYSSGKSTIINTLIRHRVLPRANKTTTTRICKIIHKSMDTEHIELKALDRDENVLVSHKFDNDELCLKCFESISPAGQKKSTPEGVTTICLYMDLSHLYPENNREEMMSRFNLVLVDTPGTDSSNSVSFVNDDSDELQNADRNVALDVVNGNGREMVILCASKDHYQSEAIGDLMHAIHRSAQKDNNGFNDRFLFVMNKCDSDDSGFNPMEEKKLFAEQLSSSDRWGVRNVYLNPRIFMTSAIFEERIQSGVPFFTEEEREENEEKDGLYEKYHSHEKMVAKKRTRYLLASLCDLPEYRKAEMQEAFELALVEDRKVDAVSIQTGIPCIVNAIQDYIERYAYPVKIRSLLETFDTLLEVITNKTNEQVRILDSLNKKLGERYSERKGVQADRNRKEEERKALNQLRERIEEQKRKIESIEPSGDMKKLRQTFSKRFDNSDVIKKIQRSGDRVKEDELRSMISSVNSLLSQMQTEIRNEYTEIVDAYNNDLHSYGQELKAIASELNSNSVLSKLAGMSLLGKRLADFEDTMRCLKQKVENTKIKKEERERHYGVGFWGNIVAGFKNIFAKKHNVSYYDVGVLKEGLQDISYNFKAECERSEREYKDSLCLYKQAAQSLADDVYSDIKEAAAIIDSFELRVAELQADENARTEEIAIIISRKEMLDDLQTKISDFNFDAKGGVVRV